MTKTKQKPMKFSDIPPVAPDDPIYSAGYIHVTPLHGRRQEESKEDPQSPPETDNQQTADKEDG